MDARERKVVSVLFCDVVGFTSASETADPEDVDALLGAYHDAVRSEIERFGGVVEKFIGDAVMAVFGAPATREDDAERAVRAAMAILEAVDVEVRIAVHTGEALVRLSARPEVGEAMVAGDVVNTASRLQGTAEPGTIVVGEWTRRATERAIEYERLGRIALRGRDEPVEVWRACGPRASFGVDVHLQFGTRFVGREADLDLLARTFERAVREARAQLVTIVGEPGVGKTRLVSELARLLHERPELVTWRQGRCLPYGDGITFWALGEMVKAHAGILETDDALVSREKLAQALGPPPDAAWLLGLLAPLVGAAGPRGAAREESFAAWRRFVELMAEPGPAVLVFDDLHWADRPLLDFVDDLVDSVMDQQLMVLCTARPELFEQQPGWGGGKRNSTTLNLSPLSDHDTARLLADAGGATVMPAELQARLLEQAGGNPLYAEEFARLLRESGPAALQGTLPPTVQALIASRLDLLSRDDKAVLQDAAVIGKVFWPGALAAVGRRDAPLVDLALQSLTRRELIKPSRRSSMAGEREHGFWHALIRDVAYAQIPRAERADRHVSAARWIEQAVGDRLEDVAELIAHHWATALTLVEAVRGPAERRAELREETRRFLGMAGDRASLLDVASAERLYAGALELTEDVGERARLLGQVGQMRAQRGEIRSAAAAHREQLALLEAQDDPHATAVALMDLGQAAGEAGDEAEAFALMERAIALLEPLGESRELARGYVERAGADMVTGRLPECLIECERALAMIDATGADELRTRVLQFRGVSGHLVGGHGERDLREALQLALDSGNTRSAVVAYNNLGDVVWDVDGPEAALAIWRAGTQLAASRGMTLMGMWNRAEALWALTDLGRWQEVVTESEVLLSWDEERGPTPFWSGPAAYRARVLLLRGDLARALPLARLARERSLATEQPQFRIPAVSVAAMAHAASGDARAAAAVLHELDDFVGESEAVRRFLLNFLPDVARTAAQVGAVAVLRRLAGERPPDAAARSSACHATAVGALAEAEHRLDAAGRSYAEAADRWRALCCPEEEARAILAAHRVGAVQPEQLVTRAEQALAGLGIARSAEPIEPSGTTG